MSNRARRIPVFAALLLAAVPIRVAALGSGNDACVDKINNDARKVLAAEQKKNRDCIRDNAGNVTSCVDATGSKTADRQAGLSADYGEDCAGNPPTFGLSPGGPATINAAAANVATTIAHELFGPAVLINSTEQSCQAKVTQRAGEIAVTRWKEFRKCKHTTLPGTLDGAALASACLGGPAGPQPDGNGKIGYREAKLASTVQTKCIGQGISPGGGTFPGACLGEADGDFADCVAERVSCAFCQGVRDADGFANSDLNCDLFDDGANNGSCAACGNGILEAGEDCEPPVSGTCPLSGDTCTATCTCVPPAGVHRCTVGGSIPGYDSTLTVHLQPGTIPSSSLSGAVDISCGSPGGSGKRTCTCETRHFDPAVLYAIGYLCIEPAGPCASGEQDCDGGNALSDDLLADHEISSSCTGNADCASQCGAYCTGLGRVALRSGCEGFCQGGARNDLACECDLLGSASCPPASTLDCPGGTCVGRNDEASTGDFGCQCQCIDQTSGLPSAAGALRCEIGLSVRLEATLPCDGSGVLLEFPPSCTSMTTETNTALLINANEIPPGQIGPIGASGVPVACSTLDTSVTSGLQLVGTIGSIDTSIGDNLTQLRLTCE